MVMWSRQRAERTVEEKGRYPDKPTLAERLWRS
jgi:hypothetical protein